MHFSKIIRNFLKNKNKAMVKDRKQIIICKELINFSPDNSRVITKFFTPGNNNRVYNIISRVLTLSEDQLKSVLDETINRFENRHRDIKRIFKTNFDKINSEGDLSMLALEQKLLIGAYFTMEYSIESAALFNPSIVPDPEQLGSKKDELKVIISFRAVGEGHISSIVFRKGLIDSLGNLSIDTKSAMVEKARIIPNHTYNKSGFISKLIEIKSYDLVKEIFDNLLDKFTYTELMESIERFKKKKEKKKSRKVSEKPSRFIQTIEVLQLLADSTYNIEFKKGLDISGRVIFPMSSNDSKGLEDARFVLFTDEDDSKRFFATYTAYNGFTILPQLIETEDFIDFKITTLNGEGSQNKGMALFPEKINGKFAMISRNDNENMFIMFSDDISYWENPQLLKEPELFWEFFQIGNSGPPLKTDKGWLLLTHGVGAVRTYSLGAIMLDLKNPEKVIAILEEPLIMPDESERNGYVPNVVYSCGAIIHREKLIIPYAMSDTRSGVASLLLDELLNKMKWY